jgi:mRNA interferase RelE/StbE
MAAYELEWRRSTKKDLRNIPTADVARIIAAAESLREEPRPQNAIKLKASDCAFRIRIGDFRLIYEIYDRKLIVEIVRVGNRKDVYRQ